MSGKELFNYIINNKEAGISLKDFLLSKGLSRHFLIRLRNQDMVTVDGKIQKFWLPLMPGQHICVNPYLAENSNVEPVEMELDILYEDGDYIVLNKPYNIATHPTSLHRNNTMANGVLYHLNKQGINSIHPVNRLDKTTSGVIVFAKHPIAQNAISSYNSSKEYRALVEGKVEKDMDLIDLPIAKIDAPSIKRIITDKGKEARTEYHVISSSDKYSLLKIILHTGRTHQIRVHLSHIGHPLVGDFLYGKENAPRLFLHSYSFSFKHFRLGLEITIRAPLPSIFFEYLEAF